MNSILSKIALNAKNVLGARTRRKIVVFDVDDYGNVRLHSKAACENLDKAGLKARSRFDQFDCLETNDDFDALFEVLRSVKDKNGRPAKFTAFALPANANFESMIDNGYREYLYEPLPETLAKLGQPYSSVMDYWKQGMRDGLIQPEFHGREHFNLKVIMEKLSTNDSAVLNCFQNRSLARIGSAKSKNIKWTSAFDFEDFSENQQHARTIEDGIALFTRVFGVSAQVFCSPGSSNHHVLFETVCKNGIKFIETKMSQVEHQGCGQFKRRFNYTGKKVANGGRLIVRNCVFEPTEPKPYCWTDFTLKQVEAAFRWNKPAIISSHRVNFCGHIDQRNRENGLAQLRELLNQLVRRWPDVEFMSTAEMAAAIGI